MKRRAKYKILVMALLMGYLMAGPVQMRIHAADKPYLSSSGIQSMYYKGKGFDLTKQSGAKKFDTMQGGATDGTYAYYVMYDRTTNRCKIAKVRMKDWKIVKLSKVLGLNHGNDMAYNSKTKKLQIVHLDVNAMRISTVDPVTLMVDGYKDVEIPEKLDGMRSALRKKIKALYGITYDSKRNEYIVAIKSLADFMVLDEEFNPVRYMEAAPASGYLNQGLDTDGNYLYLARSPETKERSYNVIEVYDMEGNYIQTTKVRKGLELENMFHVGSKFYTSFYASGVKRVKYKAKVKVKYKKKYRDKKTKKIKYKTKYKYVYKTKCKNVVVRYGYAYYTQFKTACTLTYSPGSGKGKMGDSIAYYNVRRYLNANKFKKKGYKFKGWKLYRSADDSYRGYNASGKLGWHPKEQIKKYYLYKNQAAISQLAKSGTVQLTAQWKKK